MILQYEMTGEKNLTRTERVILACRNMEFTFLRYDGVLKINTALPHVDRLVELTKRLWMVDRVETDKDISLTESIYDEAEKLAGEAAADALWRAWHDAAAAYRKSENNKRARAWYAEHYDLDAFDAIPGYDSGFIEALVHVAYEQKGEHRPDSYAAIFLWAYNLGKEAAGK